MLGEKRRIAALKRKRQRQRERALERERIRAQREWEKRNCKTSNDGYGYGYNSYANLRCVADRIIEGLFSISRRYFTLWTSYREIPSNLKNPGDDKGDATRHMYFQTLLCNNYGGSMQARLDFAKEAGDLYEECGSNNSDSTLMDYHNNAVGRDIYRRLARYEWQEVSYYFFWYYERRDKTKPYVEYMPDMYRSVAYEPYTEVGFLKNNMEALKPVKGTIPRGYVPYDYPDSEEGYQAAKSELKSPLKPDEIDDKKAANLYVMYCSVCHGKKGVVITVLIWQVNKVLSFRPKIQKSDDGVEVVTLTRVPEDSIATEKDNDSQGKFFMAFLGGLMILMVYCMFALNDLMLPESASIEGEKDDSLFAVTMWVIGIVQVAMQVILFYFSYKYRGVGGKKALFYADSHKLELIWTTIPALVLTVLISYGLYNWTTVMDLSEVEEPILIEVYAKQFQWEARYAGSDNELGRANVRNIKGINTMGVDMTDSYAQDDIPVRELHLPKGRKIVFKFRSQDVIHSAYMPHFRAQMNCVPGMVTEFGFTPKYTTEEMRKNPETIRKIKRVNLARKSKGPASAGWTIYPPLSALPQAIPGSGLGMTLCIFKGKPSGKNPWKSTSLEWTTPIERIHGNWDGEIPTVHRWAYDYSKPGADTDFIPQDQPLSPYEKKDQH
uniref:Cytochrome c oxidase subunit 2 n=1 Tax=Stylophora pistillata TaxID=50429 RepID=A0A2B4S1K0_STYPI